MEQVQSSKPAVDLGGLSADFDQLEACQVRNRTLFTQVISSLSSMLKSFEQEDNFPELSAYVRGHLRHHRCSLCRQEVPNQALLHFESLHFDEFLTWLDEKYKRRKRSKLVQHDRRRRSRGFSD